MHNKYDMIEKISCIARSAGLEIMKIYLECDQILMNIFKKSDQSPVTYADLRSHQIIVHSLNRLTPNIPIISEENVPEWKECKNWHYFWLIDPLDGTKEFLSRNGEFTVNIAFIRHGEPIIGVIYVPVYDTLYVAHNNQSWKINSFGNKVRIAVNMSCNPIIVMSRSHVDYNKKILDAYLINIKNYKILNIGSSLKFCLIAEGSAQFYPRFSSTRIWDTAAGHIIAQSAGAFINDWNGYPLNYKNFDQSFKNPGFQVSLF